MSTATRSSEGSRVAVRRGQVSPPTALASIGLGGLLVLALWLHDTPAVIGFGGWLTNAGRLTGLVAGYAIAVILLLMARVPALERGLGADRLARWHAMGGRYVVSLAVAHTLLIIWGYSVSAHTDVVSQTSSFIRSYPDVLMATVAVLVLVAIGVTSARAARRRLAYETWHFIHLYTYLAVALSFSHEFATGADFVDNAPARWLWSALYIAVAALLLWCRLAMPVRAALRHRLVVLGVRRESADVVSVYIGGRHLGELATEPGQFFRWRFLTRDLWWAANPYSLSAAARPDWLRITVKVAGGHSAALSTLAPGTKVLAEGPYGGFTATRRTRRRVLLIAGGVGITPIRALFETLPGYPGEICLLYRANDIGEFVLREELEAIARSRGAELHLLPGRPGQGSSDQLAAERVTALVPDVRQRDVFLCGPPGMMAAATRELRRAGVARRDIHRESFVF
ncbi:MAG: ferredoxin reductase family protein [Actinobacteria bacterium]|nr:ferredoxin reductase family protein [Actinomycetota bacterium]